jgi:hypothetical protein
MLVVLGGGFIANATPTLSLESISIDQGQTGSLNFLFSGDSQEYAGINAKILLPQGITVTDVSKGELLNDDFTTNWRSLSDGLAVIAYSGESNFSATGVLLTLTLSAATDTVSGDVSFGENDSSIFVRSGYALSSSDGSSSIVPTTQNGYIIVNVNNDTDNDGLPDDWETENFGDTSSGGTDDNDNDGLTNLEEYEQNTDPDNKDSDNDGIPDGWELDYGLNPLDNSDADDDPDGDALTNLEEYLYIGDPFTYTAGVALDMDIETLDYDDSISEQDIESSIGVASQDTVWVGVVGQNVKKLDTFQVEVSFDTSRVEFVGSAEDNAFGEITNLLKKNGGQTVGFQAVEISPGRVNIANALAGYDCDEAADGSGILALLQFKVIDDEPENNITLGNVFFIDCEGHEEAVTAFTHGSFNDYPQWDFSPDGIVNYLDLALFADHWLFTEDSVGWDSRYNLSDVAGSDGKQIIDYRDLQIFADHWLETAN